MALRLLSKMTPVDLEALERLEVFGDTPPKPSTPEEGLRAFWAMEQWVGETRWADEDGNPIPPDELLARHDAREARRKAGKAS